jgi:hypothetical protein
MGDERRGTLPYGRRGSGRLHSTGASPCRNQRSLEHNETPTTRRKRAWHDDSPSALGITIFHNGDEFVVVTDYGDQLGTAETLAEAQEIAEDLGCSPDDTPGPK